LEVIGQESWILDHFEIFVTKNCVKGDISRTAAKPKMVTPPGE